MAKKKVLLIDDEKDFCTTLKAHLEAISDFKVDVAFNGKSGIAAAKKTKPDVIILDIIMPDIGGHEVLERLKKDEATMAIPVVMLSALGDKESQIRAAELYGEEYLVKPLDAQALKAKIEEVLQRRGNI